MSIVKLIDFQDFTIVESKYSNRDIETKKNLTLRLAEAATRGVL